MTYYELLEVSPSADSAAIHRAYCVLAYDLLCRLRDERVDRKKQVNLAAYLRVATDAFASLVQPQVREAYDTGLKVLQQMCMVCEGRGNHDFNGLEIKCLACGGQGKSN